MSRLFTAALCAGLLSSACDANLQPTSGEVLTTASGAVTAAATTAEAATTEATAANTEPTDAAPAVTPGVTEPMWNTGPCGRSPSLAPYLYAKVWAKHAHECNVIALEISRETGVWLFGAYRSDTHECCLFLQPNSRH